LPLRARGGHLDFGAGYVEKEMTSRCSSAVAALFYLAKLKKERRCATELPMKKLKIKVSNCQTGKITIHKIGLMASNGDSVCLDCGTDTDAINESYLLHDELWLKVNPAEAGMLCVGCCEQRLGRKLRRADFTRLSLSAFDEGMPSSRRLRNRLRA
jgi:hypothetical protein